jgi:hypothetical protein
MKRVLICACLATMCSLSHAAVVDTIDAGTVAAFQSGIKVVDFESISGRTPQTINDYTSGVAVNPNSFVFDQISGVQFSVGGMVGTNEPALFRLGGDIAGDAHSGNTVLGPVDFDFTTKFGNGGLIEIFFPVKVAKVGFWVNPSLGNVHIIALNTNFAFSHDPDEKTLETGDGSAGHFVGIERASADIGGFKIEGLGNKAFTIDDFSFGSPVPEPATWAFLLAGLAALGLLRARA